MTNPQDVTGVWYGRYFSASQEVEENGFIAHLDESGGAVSGTITEPCATGMNEIRRAFVDGDRLGSQLRFTKQYDPEGPLAHSVAYSGTINDDGTEVAGAWRFSGYHGGFVMTRQAFRAEELDEEAAVDEDIVIEMDEPIAPR